MPRNPSGVYSLPPVYQVSSGDDILPDQHNTPLEDLEAEQNATRSVATGGTGGSTPQAARTALELGENDTPTFAGVTVSGAATIAGRDIAADGTKLDGVETGATADQTGAEIKSAYEAEADTNAFTDAEKTKLSGIELDANVNTLAVPANTTISSFGASLVDDADAATARTTLGAQAQSNHLDDLAILGQATQSKRIMVSEVIGGGGGGVATWNYADVVGTVSPTTGTVFERGSNANGEYVKFADGTLICWVAGITCTFAAANRVAYNWTFPTPFEDTFPIMFQAAATVAGSDYTDCAVTDIGAMFYGGVSDNDVNIGFRGAGSLPFISTSTVANCRFMAVGRAF